MLVHAVEGGPVSVGRDARGVTIGHGANNRVGRAWDALGPEQAQLLVELLDEALAASSAREIGSVTMLNGRSLHVIRWPMAVSLRVRRGEHSGFTVRVRDQAEGLRAALDEATTNGNTS